MKQFCIAFLLPLSLFLAFLQKEPPTVYFIGGSTTSDYSPDRYPRMGWGQAMPRFFLPDVRFSNRAAEGRSTKSFRKEGKWQPIMDELLPGDFVFIQFGHNDQKDYKPKLYTKPFTTFSDNLRQYVSDIRSKQATPVLVTSINRRTFNKIDRLENTLGLYPAAMRKIADELDVPLVDLHAMTADLFNSLGPEESKKLFMWLKPGEYDHYPEGVQDDTHLTEAGAETMAEMVIQSLQQQHITLIKYLK